MEEEWFTENTATRASRAEFMSVLKKLRRVLVRATLTKDQHLQSTSIADVSMDTATDSLGGVPARGVEVIGKFIISFIPCVPKNSNMYVTSGVSRFVCALKAILARVVRAALLASTQIKEMHAGSARATVTAVH